MSIRFLGACWRGNWRRCGTLLGRPAEFWAVEAAAGTGRLAAQVLDFAAERTRIVLRGVALRCRGAVGGAPRRTRQDACASPFGRRARDLRRGASAARFPPAASFPTNCWTRCRFTALLSGTARCGKCTWLARWRERLRRSSSGRSRRRIGIVFPRAGHHAAGRAAGGGWPRCLPVDRGSGRSARPRVRAHRGLRPRGRGALRRAAHARHAAGVFASIARREDFLRAPGEQDLTAHVNFTALDLWGRRFGADAHGLRQSDGISGGAGPRERIRGPVRAGASEVERIRARLLLKTLIHPEGMGETFHVFVQQKGIGRRAAHSVLRLSRAC